MQFEDGSYEYSNLPTTLDKLIRKWGSSGMEDVTIGEQGEWYNMRFSDGSRECGDVMTACARAHKHHPAPGRCCESHCIWTWLHIAHHHHIRAWHFEASPWALDVQLFTSPKWAIQIAHGGCRNPSYVGAFGIGVLQYMHCATEMESEVSCVIALERIRYSRIL